VLCIFKSLEQVAVLDVDVCGPSIPLLMGLEGEQVHQSGSGWSPIVRIKLIVMCLIMREVFDNRSRNCQKFEYNIHILLIIIILYVFTFIFFLFQYKIL